MSFAKRNFNFDIFNNPECWGLTEAEEGGGGFDTAVADGEEAEELSK